MDVALRADGFANSLDVLYGGLGISKSQYLIKKNTVKSYLLIFSPVVNLFFFVIKILDLEPNPHPYLPKMLGPDPH
jgi:hypothetical protein